MKTYLLAPEKPKTFFCPDCWAEKPRVKIKFKHSLFEEWGTVITRHDVYRCPVCKEHFVSTNGRKPETAADWVK